MAPASVCGSKASESAVSAAKACSRPRKSSSNSGMPSTTDHAACSPCLLWLFGKRAWQLHANSLAALQVAYTARGLTVTSVSYSPPPRTELTSQSRRCARRLRCRGLARKHGALARRCQSRANAPHAHAHQASIRPGRAPIHGSPICADPTGPAVAWQGLEGRFAIQSTCCRTVLQPDHVT